MAERTTGGYLPGDCPNCGRSRLESIIETATEKVVGIRCEKCRMQWPLDSDRGEYWAEDDERNPLRTFDSLPEIDFGSPTPQNPVEKAPQSPEEKG